MIEAPDLSLYVYEGCGYCARVLRALGRLGVRVEIRDIDEEPKHEAALLSARGRRTVPVLRIAGPDGRVEWMPESADIVDYLERRFGGAPPGPRASG